MNSFPRFVRPALLALALGALFGTALRADSPAATLEAANRAYTYGSYEESAKLLQELIGTNGYSAPLCFNLGNAEERAGHPGQAILNYERARYLAPADRDINHNLQLARKQAGLEPNSYRWWEVALRLVYPVVGYLVIAGLLVILGAVVGSVIAGRNQLPGLRTVFRAIIFTGIPICLFLGFIELSAIGFTDRIEGVIVANKEAVLRLSPFESAEKVGTIPEGELVTVEQRHNNYYRVEGRDHHYGWVQAKEIEPVIAGSF